MTSTLNMSPYHYVLVVLSITLSTTFKGDMYLTEALNGGFSIELIHRDSPKSPFYNSSEIQIERTTNAIHCSFERVKHFYPEDGIVGLGNGVTSLTSQLGSITDNKFSYCLSQEPNIPSLLNFGEKVAVSSIGTISTPLEYVPSSSHYHLSLNGMTVAGKRLNFFNPVIGNAGNIILDLGTTLTFLPTYFYTKLESLVATQINLRPFPFKELLPKGQKLCYKSPPSAFKAPPITVHFAGANIVLNTLNTFGLYDGLMCFTFNLDDKVSIFGSIAQTNFPVGIDRQKKVVFFKPTDCTKLQS
ncbi:hypothetical protein Lal_00025010 [Lupinus albus]|nr:hypothetical protein Lal_00025010 [Lupinus albus]